MTVRSRRWLPYVINSDSNSVSVINTDTNTVAATIKVGLGPAGVAVNPATHTAYFTIQVGNYVSVYRQATRFNS